MVIFDALKLRELRLSQDPALSQEELAEELDIDVRTYRRYERGSVNHPVRGFECRIAKQKTLVQRLSTYFGLPDTDNLLREVPSSVCQATIQTQPRESDEPAHWYVNRDPTESLVLRYLQEPDSPVVLYAPEKFGKTSLIHSVLHRLRANTPGWHMVWVRLMEFSPEKRLSYDSFLQEFSVCLMESLNLEAGQLQSKRIDERATPTWRLRNLLCQALSSVSGNLVLVIDNAETFLDAPFRDSLFGLLRSVMGRPDDPWPRLRLVVAGSVPPSMLAGDTDQSPFASLCPPIYLPGFSREQVDELVDRYHLPSSMEEVAGLMALVGGHPWLLRLALDHAAVSSKTLSEILVPSVYLSIFDTHLRRCQRLLTKRPELRELLHRVAWPKEDAVGTDLSCEAEALRGVGIVERCGHRRFRLRGDLYRMLL